MERKIIMEFDWIWKAVLIIVVGTLLLRIAGRKSISQMTLAQTVLMIGIGSLLIQPVAGENIWVTFGVGAILVLTLIIMEYMQVKVDGMEKFITGKAVILVENGRMNENMRRYRLSADLLEMLLRQKNVSKISDVEYATLEPNGQIGFTLKPEAQPVKKRDIDAIQQQLNQLQLAVNKTPVQSSNQEQSNQENIFSEVANKGHETTPPKRLQ